MFRLFLPLGVTITKKTAVWFQSFIVFMREVLQFFFFEGCLLWFLSVTRKTLYCFSILRLSKFFKTDNVTSSLYVYIKMTKIKSEARALRVKPRKAYSG